MSWLLERARLHVGIRGSEGLGDVCGSSRKGSALSFIQRPRPVQVHVDIRASASHSALGLDSGRAGRWGWVGRWLPGARWGGTALWVLGLRWGVSLTLLLAAGPLAAQASGTGEDQAGADRGGEASAEELVVQVDSVRLHVGAAPKARYVAGWVVRGERLEVAGIQAAEVLRESPGVQVTQVGGFGAPATASLRGATAAQTPVYVAGIRVNDEVGGAANLADVPLFLIDRVEVYRSHAPLVADRLGLGGAIFFEPKRPDGHEFGLGAMSGSFGSRAGWAYVGSGDEGGSLLAGFQASGAENDYSFHDDRGTLYRQSDDRPGRLQNADARSQSFWLSARRAVGRAWLSAVMNHTAREQGAPKLATVPSEQARIRFGRTLVGLRALTPLEWEGGHGSVEARTSVVDSRAVVEDPLHELGLLSSRTETPGTRVEELVSTRQCLGDLSLVQQLSLSVEGLKRYRRDEGSQEQELSARRSMLRATVGAEYGLSEFFFVEGMGALECFATATGKLGLCDAAAPTGRLGASFRRKHYELYANAGKYHRLPTLSELYGVSFLVRGNDELDHEYGYSAEIGGRWHWLSAASRRLLWTDASVFGRETRDLVTYVRTAQGFMHPLNRERARTLGAETLLGASPWRWVEGEVSLSLLDARDTTPERQVVNDILPFISRFVGAARLSFQSEFDQTILERLRLSLLAVHQSSRYADPAGLGVIPAQDNLDVELEAMLLEERFRASLRIANILDTERFDVIGFPLPGRSGFLSLEARL